MFEAFSAAGLRVHTPFGPRKSGMPGVGRDAGTGEHDDAASGRDRCSGGSELDRCSTVSTRRDCYRACPASSGDTGGMLARIARRRGTAGDGVFGVVAAVVPRRRRRRLGVDAGRPRRAVLDDRNLRHDHRRGAERPPSRRAPVRRDADRRLRRDDRNGRGRGPHRRRHMALPDAARKPHASGAPAHARCSIAGRATTPHLRVCSRSASSPPGTVRRSASSATSPTPACSRPTGRCATRTAGARSRTRRATSTSSTGRVAPARTSGCARSATCTPTPP